MKRRTRVIQDSAKRQRKRTSAGLQTVLDERERLRRLNEELQQFTPIVGHDLREPLRMVSAYAQLLTHRYRGKLDEDADEFLERVVTGAEWMTRLVSDLLAYARAGGEKVQLIPVDSERIFACAVRNLRVSLAEAGASIECGRLPKVLANDQLALIFQNLIGNAIKYRAHARPSIQVSAQRSDEGDWCFCVADNGIGFDMAQADKLFQPFYRGGGNQGCAGTGMGLAICRRVIHQLGGRMWVHSEPGKGSSFFFSVRPAPEDDQSIGSSPSSPLGAVSVR